jgi:hypothetical protein
MKRQFAKSMSMGLAVFGFAFFFILKGMIGSPEVPQELQKR